MTTISLQGKIGLTIGICKALGQLSISAFTAFFQHHSSAGTHAHASNMHKDTFSPTCAGRFTSAICVPRCTAYTVSIAASWVFHRTTLWLILSCITVSVCLTYLTIHTCTCEFGLPVKSFIGENSLQCIAMSLHMPVMPKPCEYSLQTWNNCTFYAHHARNVVEVRYAVYAV